MKKIMILFLVIGFIFGMIFNLIQNNQEMLLDEQQNLKSKNTSLEEKVMQMSIKEKVGQMLMIHVNQLDQMNADLTSLIKDYHIGGIILFSNNIKNTDQLVHFTAKLQQATDDVSLFIGMDQEGGKVKRFEEGTGFPGNMALGATDQPYYSYQAGRIIGNEIKALGVNVNFAPVLDVNNNPLNPVIGIRSFGEDPNEVANHGVEFIKGLHDANIIAVAKHFPGHGDTKIDSHIGLPEVAVTKDRLDKLELIPFKSAIQGDVDMVMTGHIMFPEIDDKLPATLSKKIITGILREELQFDGVVVTDSFLMKAISKHFEEEEAVIKAIEAGADIILMPRDVKLAYQSIIKAVQNGRIEVERINESVLRILQVKEKYGLLRKEELLAKELNLQVDFAKETISTPLSKSLEQEIADKAVTLIRNKNDILPFQTKVGDGLLLIAKDERVLELIKNSHILDRYRLRISSITYQDSKKLSDEVKKEIKLANHVIIFTNNLAESNSELNYMKGILSALEENKKAAFIALGNPYDMILISDVAAYLAIYGEHESNLVAGIKAVMGEISPEGKLPVTIPLSDYEIILRGHGLTY